MAGLQTFRLTHKYNLSLLRSTLDSVAHLMWKNNDLLHGIVYFTEQLCVLKKKKNLDILSKVGRNKLEVS